jgi:hypothetical protein
MVVVRSHLPGVDLVAVTRLLETDRVAIRLQTRKEKASMKLALPAKITVYLC